MSEAKGEIVGKHNSLTTYERSFTPEVQGDLESLRALNAYERKMAKTKENAKKDEELNKIVMSIHCTANLLVREMSEYSFSADGSTITISSPNKKAATRHDCLIITLIPGPETIQQNDLIEQLARTNPEGIQFDVDNERGFSYAVTIAGARVWASKYDKYQPILTNLQSTLKKELNTKTHG